MNSLGIRNVLLTGASGKVGRAVLPELLRAGYRIRALEFTDGLHVPEYDGVEVVRGDLREESLSTQLLQDMDAVIHLANVKENRDLFLDANVKGTFYLLDACKANGHIRQFIQAGSDARAGIYYYPQPTPITENHPHRGYPGYYPLSKVLEEVLCEQYIIQCNLSITVLRFSWVHAEDDLLAHITLREPNFGVPVWKELADTPEKTAYFEKDQDAVANMLHSDGRPCKRQIVGIGDVTHSILRALNNPAALGEAFNISGPAPFRYAVLAEYVSKSLELPVVDFVNLEFHDFCIDLTKSRQVLGYNPQWDIFRIADDAIAFRKAGKIRTDMKYIG